MDEMDDILRLIRKLEANSYYPLDVPNKFYFYNKETAEAITKCGKWQIRKLLKKFKVEPK